MLVFVAVRIRNFGFYQARMHINKILKVILVNTLKINWMYYLEQSFIKLEKQLKFCKWLLSHSLYIVNKLKHQ